MEIDIIRGVKVLKVFSNLLKAVFGIEHFYFKNIYVERISGT